MEVMRWSNFTYVLHKEGKKSAVRVAIHSWIRNPWLSVRVKIASIVLSILRVGDKFE